MLQTPPPSPKPFGLCDPEDRLGQILAGRIQLTGILGVGAYGTVYQALDIQTNVQYAVKALNKFGLDPRQKKFQEREIRLHYLAGQQSPNIVSMQKIVDTPDCTYVVLEYCAEGDLFAKITEEGDYLGNDLKTRDVFLQIIDAVRHCHSQGIYHRDLKPENILVKDDGWTVKLADFGLATQDAITSDYGCGSTFYMSPECQQSHTNVNAGYKSVPNDVWSLGVILVNLTCGRNPWKRASLEDSTFRAFMRDQDFLRTILPISDEVNDILKRIFDVNPETRIGLNELRHRIDTCQFFSQDSFERALATPPLTPPLSPVEKPAGSVSNSYGNGLEPIPHVDQLPVPQFPPFSDIQYNAPQPSTAAFHIPTPPASTHGSPRSTNLNTFPARPMPSAPLSPFFNQPGFFPSIPSPWSRCSNFVPDLGACWRNVPVF